MPGIVSVPPGTVNGPYWTVFVYSAFALAGTSKLRTTIALATIDRHRDIFSPPPLAPCGAGIQPTSPSQATV
jgi:hypothetical protein